MPLGATMRIIGQLTSGSSSMELPFHYPSWRKMCRAPERGRAGGSLAKIRTQFDLRPHRNIRRWHKSMGASASTCKRSTMARRMLSKKDIGFPDRMEGTYGHVVHSGCGVPRTFLRWRPQLLERDDEPGDDGGRWRRDEAD
ncbi:hypothetical protein Tco_0137871 [Tanacetum coccineum]